MRPSDLRDRYRDDDGDTIPIPIQRQPSQHAGQFGILRRGTGVGFPGYRRLDLSFNWSFNDNEYTEFLIPWHPPNTRWAPATSRDTAPAASPSGPATSPPTYGEPSRTAGTGRFAAISRTWQTFPGLTNLATLQSYSLLNLRFAVERNDLRVEAYVKNALDEDYWRTGQEYTDFSRVLSVGFNFNRLA